MDKLKAVFFLESLPWNELLKDKDVTDISYNGKDIYYFHNFLGRQKSDYKMDFAEASNFVRQIANLTESPFSLSDPILDVSFGRYRLNAVHHTIGRFNDEKAITFSIRMMSYSLKISDEDIPLSIQDLFDIALMNKLSVVIAGSTGSGKTELEKYLLSKMRFNERIVIIDNVNELNSAASNGQIDANFWIVDKEIGPNIQSLVKNSLRSNPDWIIIAESRGKEMLDILNAVMTGHPAITTLHAFDASSIVERMTNMILMNDQKIDSSDVMKDLLYHFRLFVFMKREVSPNGIVRRYIFEIAFGDGKTNPTIIYESDGKIEKYHKMSSKMVSNLKISDIHCEFRKCFMEGKDDE